MSDDPRSPWADDSGFDGEPTGETPQPGPSTPYDHPYEEAIEPPPPPPPTGNEPTTMIGGGGVPPSGPPPTAMAMPLPPPDRRRWYNDKPAAAAAAGVGVALLFLLIAGLIWYFSRDEGGDSIATIDSSSTTTIFETTTTLAVAVAPTDPSSTSSTSTSSSTTTSSSSTTTTTTTTTTVAPTTTATPTTVPPATTTTTSIPVVSVPPSPGATTWDIIQVSADLSRLRELVVLAGLEDELDSVTELSTILAPSNQAFETYEILNDLDDPAVARDLLLRHVAPGSLTTSNIFSVTHLQMLNGVSMPIDGPAQTIGDNAAVVQVPDVRSANGYLHAIDKVLALPLP